MTTLTDEERIAWVRLLRTPRIGPKNFFQLLELYGSPEKALEALPILAHRGGSKKPFIPFSRENALREIERTYKYGAQMLMHSEDAYPTYLKNIADPPPILTVIGDTSLLCQTKNVAIVGSRNCSTNGVRITERFSHALSNKKWIIISGLARGIDRAAHDAALLHGTVAVMAGGINRIYPPEHIDLAEIIAKEGIIVTERPFDAPPLSVNFPQRNRIISGMSLGVLIVEARYKSGTLSTARMAANQGREVFAVPGFPLDPFCQGTNALLKDGAVLSRYVEDILEVLDPHIENIQRAKEREHLTPYKKKLSPPDDESLLAEARHNIPSSIGASLTSIDELARRTGYPVNVLLTILLEMELAGKLEQRSGGQVSMLM